MTSTQGNSMMLTNRTRHTELKPLGTSRSKSIRLSREYSLDPKAAYALATLYKSKYINNVFVTNERNADIYKNNINLQKKLDNIKQNGSGMISNRVTSGKRLSSDLSNRLVSANKMNQKGPIEMNVLLHKKYNTSMNFRFEKRKA